MSSLLVRAIAAFLLLPGMVAFAVPIFLLAPRKPFSLFNPLGLAPLAVGIVLLLWCVQQFYAAGKGTLAPWSPPQNLVVSGPYRFSRNPMYVAVVLVLVGWAVSFRSARLAVYAALMTVVFHLRVVLFEEPWLTRTHGGEWIRYQSQVRRWF